MSVSHEKNVCKSQTTLMPVFSVCEQVQWWFFLHIIYQEPIRTITDHYQNSYVYPLQKYSEHNYFVTYIHIFYFETYRHILYHILLLTDTFSILWLTDTFIKFKIWCNWKYLWVIRLCTVDPVWAEYTTRTILEKLFYKWLLWLFCDLQTSYVRVVLNAFFT